MGQRDRLTGLDGVRLAALRGSTTQVDLEFQMRQRYGVRGLSRATIQNYESGRTQPKASELALLVDLFGVSADYLLGLTDDAAPAAARGGGEGREEPPASSVSQPPSEDLADAAAEALRDAETRPKRGRGRGQGGRPA